MANLVTFAKKLWKDATSGGTPITAAELNRMEGGISNCATQINKLGDSVSRIGGIETIAIARQSHNEPAVSVIAREWPNITTDVPVMALMHSSSSGSAFLAIIYKTSSQYGVAFTFGYDDQPTCHVLYGGK